MLVGFFALALFVLIVVGDWMHFTGLTADASRYGFGVARIEDRLKCPLQAIRWNRFDANGFVNLPHGVARFFKEENRILVRPQYRLFSLNFRTAWPLKGSIEVHQDEEIARLTCVKRIPWSSAVITLVWFALVGFGTIGFSVAFGLQGGMASLGSALLVLGVVGAGLLVFAFGLITVSLAYRVENERLSQVYRELREILEESSKEHSQRSGAS